MFDVVIRGGMVLDGTGGPAFRADVGLAGGRITVVGPLPCAEAATVVDATRRFVPPGFIDTHVHGDAAVFDSATQLAALRQGSRRWCWARTDLLRDPPSMHSLRQVAGHPRHRRRLYGHRPDQDLLLTSYLRLPAAVKG
jgi:N-acyl-D-amino-acid deacylase